MGNSVTITRIHRRSVQFAGSAIAGALMFAPVAQAADVVPCPEKGCNGVTALLVGGQGSYATLTEQQMDWYGSHYLPSGVDHTDPLVSPLLAPSLEGLPPAHVVTAGFDPLRDEGEAYAERLREAGVPVTLRRHPDLIHGFINMMGTGRSARAATVEMGGVLRQALSTGS